MDVPTLELATFTCPRCGQEVEQRLYGPCATCREELGERLRRVGETPAAPAAYVPKMNVVPNQIATKE